jgi:alkanesulfonate monooxygenase
MSLRFHWSLSRVGDNLRATRPMSEQTGFLSFDAQADFCRRAEEYEIESVLMAFTFTRPDPVVLSMALGMKTNKMKFMIAIRSGIISPTLFVQQVNTVSSLTNGRVCINMVTGHIPHELGYYGDFLPHDERYARTDEFLSICRAYWRRDGEVNFSGRYYKVEHGRLNIPFIAEDRSSPEIYLGGNSLLADEMAIKHADCLWRFPDAPEKLEPRIRPVVEKGTEVGLLVSLIARPTREQAIRDAKALIETVGANSKQFQKEALSKCDSVGVRTNFKLAENNESEWVTPYLWTGAIPYLGAPAIALVGSSEEIASAIIKYKQIGISQFLFMGWPDLEEMLHFSREVLPLIRKKEQEVSVAAHPDVLQKVSETQQEGSTVSESTRV